MGSLNQVVRFALSDAAGVGPSGLSISSKIEAGAAGLLVRGCTQVGGVCTDYSGNIYVSDSAEHAIYKIDEKPATGPGIDNLAHTSKSISTIRIMDRSTYHITRRWIT